MEKRYQVFYRGVAAGKRHLVRLAAVKEAARLVQNKGWNTALLTIVTVIQ